MTDMDKFIDAREAEGIMLTPLLQPQRERGWRYSLFDGKEIAAFNGTRLTATHDTIPGAKAALAEMIEGLTDGDDDE